MLHRAEIECTNSLVKLGPNPFQFSSAHSSVPMEHVPTATVGAVSVAASSMGSFVPLPQDCIVTESALEN